MYEYRARCVEVHDGDTITFDLDLGFGIRIPGKGWSGRTELSCRVAGINAPELSTLAGKNALNYAQTLIKPGDVVTVVSLGWDKYGGRFDGVITLPDGRDFATLMLSSGNAVAYPVLK